MSEAHADDHRIVQYDDAPAPGMTRFWMSVVTWCEDLPENAPFFYWLTGSGMDYRVRPSVIAMCGDDKERLERLKTEARLKEDDEESDLFEKVYVSNATVCMLVDAPDEDAAWATVREQFPDMLMRFIGEAPEKTLSTLASGGRFQKPEPAPEAPEGETSGTAMVP